MIERRGETRLRSLLGGRIDFANRRCSMDCVVRNVAPHGAMIEFAQSALTPTGLVLDIPHRGETHAARVVWRRGNRVGLALSLLRKAEAQGDPASKLRRLEAENRRLRDRLNPGAW